MATRRPCLEEYYNQVTRATRVAVPGPGERAEAARFRVPSFRFHGGYARGECVYNQHLNLMYSGKN